MTELRRAWELERASDETQLIWDWISNSTDQHLLDQLVDCAGDDVEAFAHDIYVTLLEAVLQGHAPVNYPEIDAALLKSLSVSDWNLIAAEWLN